METKEDQQPTTVLGWIWLWIKTIILFIAAPWLVLSVIDSTSQMITDILARSNH